MAEQAMEVLKILGTAQLKYADRLNRYIEYKVPLGVLSGYYCVQKNNMCYGRVANDRS